MPKRIYFFELTAEFGIESGLPPRKPDGPNAGADQPVTHPNVWSKENGRKLIALLQDRIAPGETLDYDGHADCWLMLALMDQMRNRNISAYIGAFHKSLPIVAYRIGKQPTDGQPCRFTVEAQGDNVLLTVHLEPDKGPFDMEFGDIVAPEIPKGKNIFVRLEGRHLLFAFPVSLTYGEHCRSICMDYSGQCICAVSNTTALEPGDTVENPFEHFEKE